jgi:hypothetical protein
MVKSNRPDFVYYNKWLSQTHWQSLDFLTSPLPVRDKVRGEVRGRSRQSLKALSRAAVTRARLGPSHTHVRARKRKGARQ